MLKTSLNVLLLKNYLGQIIYTLVFCIQCNNCHSKHYHHLLEEFINNSQSKYWRIYQNLHTYITENYIIQIKLLKIFQALININVLHLRTVKHISRKPTHFEFKYLNIEGKGILKY